MNDLVVKSAVSASTAALIAVLGWLSGSLPGGASGAVYFGVTVPSDFPSSPDGLAARDRFTRTARTHAILGALVTLSGIPAPSDVLWTLLLLLGLLWGVVGLLLAFLSARRIVLPHAVTSSHEIRQASLTPRKFIWAGGLPAQIGPFLILLTAAALLTFLWDHIPTNFPTHWNIYGQPDRWSSRTPAAVFSVPSIGIAMCGFLIGTMAFLQYGMRFSTGAARQRQTRLVHLISAVLLGAEYLVAFTFSLISLAPLFAGDGTRSTPTLMFVPLVLDPIFLLLAAYAIVQYQRSAPPPDPAGDGTPDACWKLGLFYVNRADPALFIEKRFGIGYTLNFGNPTALLLMTLLTLASIAVPITIALLATRH